MTPRSRIHMLMVAAARLEADRASPKLVADLRSAAKEAAEQRADGRGWTPEDEQRVERQRTLFAFLPSSEATDRLKVAMLQRAYNLMWDGDALACDALLEFMPSSDGDRVLDAWLNDQDPKNERSRFYEEES